MNYFKGHGMSMTDHLGHDIDYLTPDSCGIGLAGDHAVANILLEAAKEEIGQQHTEIIHGIRSKTLEGQDLATKILYGSKD